MSVIVTAARGVAFGATIVASLFASGFVAWLVTYFFIDGSEPESPGTDPGAGLAFLGLLFVFAPVFVAAGSVLSWKFVIRKIGRQQGSMNSAVA